MKRPVTHSRTLNSPVTKLAGTQDYRQLVQQILRTHHIRVRRWRTNMSGCAWSVVYADGRTVKLIEAPFPKTPISLAIFLHEVGHHAIGFNRYRVRCEEEYHVWQWAIDQMRQLSIEPGERVMARYRLSMQYAVSKALRRGLTRLPVPLQQFVQAA